MSLDARIAELAKKYLPIAAEILKEAIRIPADYVDGKDPMCGTSNHEEPRIKYLREAIIKYKAVEKEEDVYFDDFGSLYWTVSDPSDGIPLDKKKVVYFDGHTDTVNALRAEWPKRVGEGLDSYNGLLDINKANIENLKKELGYIPPKEEWDNLIFGRGSADQLAGVISEILATKIMLELRPEGALKGVIIRAYGTIAEEDNDGGSPMYICTTSCLARVLNIFLMLLSILKVLVILVKNLALSVSIVVNVVVCKSKSKLSVNLAMVQCLGKAVTPSKLVLSSLPKLLKNTKTEKLSRMILSSNTVLVLLLGATWILLLIALFLNASFSVSIVVSLWAKILNNVLRMLMA